MGEGKYGRWRVVNAPDSRFFGVHSERQGTKPGGRIAARIESRDVAYQIAAVPLMLEALETFPFKISQRETWEEYGARVSEWWEKAGRPAQKAAAPHLPLTSPSKDPAQS